MTRALSITCVNIVIEYNYPPSYWLIEFHLCMLILIVSEIISHIYNFHVMFVNADDHYCQCQYQDTYDIWSCHHFTSEFADCICRSTGARVSSSIKCIPPLMQLMKSLFIYTVGQTTM